MNNKVDKLKNDEYIKYGLALYALFAPVALRLPELRKGSTNKSLDDMEQKIKNNIGKYQVIIKLIESEKNYLAKKDDQWGSVIALVDGQSNSPVVGIVANPSKRLFYFGIKSWGAYVLAYNEKYELMLTNKMSFLPDFGYEHFSYDNKAIAKVVHNKKDEKYIFSESNVLEAARNRGAIFLKTGREMAALAVILNEIGGKVTDKNGLIWTLESTSIISGRTEKDWKRLKNIFNSAATTEGLEPPTSPPAAGRSK